MELLPGSMFQKATSHNTKLDKPDRTLTVLEKKGKSYNAGKRDKVALYLTIDKLLRASVGKYSSSNTKGGLRIVAWIFFL